MRALFLLAMLGWAGAAAADLYRWVDPESGSVKFSNTPPPWYGDAAKERRAPKVELIPSRRNDTATPATGDKPDPQGAAARRGEMQTTMDKTVKDGAK